ncbi:MAG TPA: tetratricopeptide repeat protein [Sphingomicrobium sp.]
MIAASVAAATPSAAPPLPLPEIEHALAAGRIEQARLMIGRAVAAGASGPQVERLLADLAFASGRNDEALPRYLQLSAANPKDSLLAERAAITALRLNNLPVAELLVVRATSAPAVTWRAWNARGVLADLKQDWPGADAAYARAAALAPGEAETLNNRGWSNLLRGDWKSALDLFEQAAARDPTSTRIANNLELAQAALASELPKRRPNEDDRAWAARLNDAGIAARLLGDRQRAIAAFTQALEASGSWYDRAANNLQATKTQ